MPITLKQHPLSAKLPAMPEDDFLAMMEDIQAHGQREYITIYEGKVLDGWHRHEACVQLGIEPKIKKFTGKDAAAFVLSENIHRRHLSASVRAMLVVELCGNANALGGSKIRPPPMTNAKMVEISGTSSQTIIDAKKVGADGSVALKNAVLKEEIAVSTAAKISKEPKQKQAKAIKEAKQPKPKKTKPESDEKLTALQAECDELKEHCRDVEDELKTSVALMATKPAIEMQKVRGELRRCIDRRDELMAQVKSMAKQIAWWKKEAIKLGWKPSK